MTDRPHLQNAPIIEAIFDIRTVLPAKTRLAQLQAIQSEIRNRYPHRRTRKRVEGPLDVGGEGEVKVTKRAATEDGFLFQSTDGSRIVQARLDGFTFNQLKPYGSWETFRDEAKEHWARYVEIAHPELVTRIALRFINRLELPLPLSDFKDYVLTAPDIAPGIPQGVQNLFVRLEIPYPNGALAIVTETIVPPDHNKGDDALPFILDIDAIREETLNPPFAGLDEKFEQLRRIKNDVFFSSITSAAVRLFQ